MRHPLIINVLFFSFRITSNVTFVILPVRVVIFPAVSRKIYEEGLGEGAIYLRDVSLLGIGIGIVYQVRFLQKWKASRGEQLP